MTRRRKQSVIDAPQFRPLDGPEAREVFTQKIVSEFTRELERHLEGSNNFLSGDVYPAVSVDGQLKINVLPYNNQPYPFYVNIHFLIGTTPENAPDRMRELHGLQVLQPQQRPSGFIMNQVVERSNDDGKNQQDEGKGSDPAGESSGREAD